MTVLTKNSMLATRLLTILYRVTIQIFVVKDIIMCYCLTGRKHDYNAITLEYIELTILNNCYLQQTICKRLSLYFQLRKSAGTRMAEPF